MKPAKVLIVDTNVLVAGMVTSNPLSPTARILDAMLSGDLIFALSMELLAEYREVLLRPKLIDLHGLSHDQTDQILAELTANAIWHETLGNISQKAPDLGDNHLWRLLATSPDSILITGDKLLYENPPQQGSVMLPATCVELFLR